MVSNNQRKRRSSICWRGRRELITDVRKPKKSWLWRHCEAESYLLITPITSQTCHAKPKTQINRRGLLPDFFPVGGMPPKQLGLKDFSRKVRTLWHCNRLRSVALYLWLIVVISVRQSTVAAISGLHCRALVMVSSSRLTAWLQNSKRAERSEIDAVEAKVTRLSPLWLSASSSACHGLLIITVMPVLQSPARQKCQRTEAGERGNCWHADASMMLLRSMQNTRRVSWC